MAGVSYEKRVEQVVRVLDELKHLHDELAVVVKGKIQAMRAADTDALRSAVAREGFLTQRIREQDGLRRQIMELVGELLGLSPDEAGRMTVSELAQRTVEPARSRLLAVAAAIREKAQEAARANEVAAMITAEMLKHFRHVFEVMAQVDAREVGLYSRTGRTEARAAMSVFEAVG